jgi:hypothetical protein
MKKERKPNLSPEAAKRLEQYRNAGKSPGAPSGDAAGTDGDGSVTKPNTPPPAQQMRRSGTRGK